MLILRCLASAATRTPPNAAHSKQKGAWKSSFVGGLCPRTHKLGTRHRGHGSCRPLPHGSEGSLPPYCLQAPPLSPQPEPTGSELPTPRPACPHSRDSAGPDVQPCVGSSHHPLLPQQEATLLVLGASVDFEFLKCVSIFYSSYWLYPKKVWFLVIMWVGASLVVQW